MISVEKSKVIIEVNSGEDYEHAFIHGLQYDLIQLMNGLPLMVSAHDLEYPFNTSFYNIKLLQEALIPCEEDAEQLYPFKPAKKNQIEEKNKVCTDDNIPQLELHYVSAINSTDPPVVHDSDGAYELFMPGWNVDQIELIEEFKVMLLNSRNVVLGIVDIAKGGMDSVTVDPKLIFASALKSGASRIIMAHNHPGNHLDPSEADIELTEKIQEGAVLLDIEILDHLIISKDNFYSLTDHGKM